MQRLVHTQVEPFTGLQSKGQSLSLTPKYYIG